MLRRSPFDDDNVDAFDIEAVCRRSNTGRSFVYEEIRAGRLIAKKFGRLTRVLRADYEAWLAAAPSISPGPASARTTHEPTPALNPGLGACPSNVCKDAILKFYCPIWGSGDANLYIMPVQVTHSFVLAITRTGS